MLVRLAILAVNLSAPGDFLGSGKRTAALIGRQSRVRPRKGGWQGESISGGRGCPACVLGMATV